MGLEFGVQDLRLHGSGVQGLIRYGGRGSGF